MPNQFKVSVLEQDGRKQIDFVNNTDNFVEVVFTIDGKEVKYGNAFAENIRGYCYPPFHHKPIRKMANEDVLPFSQSGTVQAYVYGGIGKTIEKDYDVPPFIRFKLGERKYDSARTDIDKILRDGSRQKAVFKRTSNRPIAFLEIPY